MIAKWALPKGALATENGLWADLSATYEVSFGNKLRLQLTVTNEGKKAVDFENALHTYLKVSDIEKIRIDGLQKVKYVDKVPGKEGTRSSKSEIRFGGEMDRIYLGSGPVTVKDGTSQLQIRTDGASNIVIWNPGGKRAKEFADIKGSEWRNFVCVEAANALDDALRLKPGKSHTMKYELAID